MLLLDSCNMPDASFKALSSIPSTAGPEYFPYQVELYRLCSQPVGSYSYPVSLEEYQP